MYSLPFKSPFDHNGEPFFLSDSLENGTTTKKCPLCLEPRIETSSTICGHLFCWTCIHESVRNRSECPICREPLRPAQIIRLMNYS